eukprot:1179537-Prorocentrum_minimum.AAC.1
MGMWSASPGRTNHTVFEDRDVSERAYKGNQSSKRRTAEDAMNTRLTKCESCPHSDVVVE